MIASCLSFSHNSFSSPGKSGCFAEGCSHSSPWIVLLIQERGIDPTSEKVTVQMYSHKEEKRRVRDMTVYDSGPTVKYELLRCSHSSPWIVLLIQERGIDPTSEKVTVQMYSHKEEKRRVRDMTVYDSGPTVKYELLRCSPGQKITCTFTMLLSWGKLVLGLSQGYPPLSAGPIT